MGLKYIVFALSLIFTSQYAIAGPFGFDEVNFNLDSFGCKQTKGSFYKCSAIPKPHPDIERYIVQYNKDIGLCMVKGISVDINDSRFGMSTRSKVDEIYDQLQGKYGAGEKIDFLMSGSIWSEPEDWMMGMVKDERMYAYTWDLKNPIDAIEQVGLIAKAVDQETSFFVVEFLTAKSSECDRADSKSGADSF